MRNCRFCNKPPKVTQPIKGSSCFMGAVPYTNIACHCDYCTKMVEDENSHNAVKTWDILMGGS